MLRYILRRLIGMVVLLLILSVIVFGIFYMLPASPAAMSCGKACNPQTIAAKKRAWGLDKPIQVQYADTMKAIFVGRTYHDGRKCGAPCLGYSFQLSQPVTKLIQSRAPVTASLAIGAAIMWLIIGIAVGVLSALRKGSIFDRSAMTVALVGVSMPSFFTGLVVLYIFCAKFQWLPWPHYYSIMESPPKFFQNMILPWTVVAFLNAALYARLTRANMLETMNEDYIRTARAKGLPERTVVAKHGLRAALTPLITIFGMDLGLLLGGAVLAEQVFTLPGLGKLTVDAVNNADLPVLFAVTLVAALFVISANLIVDLLYAVVDPRVKLQ
ncbi:MAG: ABC transporter permease [Mycobacteriales bacterium]|jgi:peptide/nickel transport system permease protein